jgi:hypothetical protein
VAGYRSLLIAHGSDPPDTRGEVLIIAHGQVLRPPGYLLNFCCRRDAPARLAPAVALPHFSTAFRMTSTAAIATAVTASAVTR